MNPPCPDCGAAHTIQRDVNMVRVTTSDQPRPWSAQCMECGYCWVPEPPEDQS
jgi:hypothetical protein